MLRDGDWQVRQSAFEALCQIGIGDARAVESLCAALQDRAPNVRCTAAEALGQIGVGDAHAVESLCAALQDADKDVRRHAAAALDQLDWHPQSLEAEAAYCVAKGKWDRCVAIGAPCVELLCAALKDGDWQVRGEAAGALGKIGDARAVEPLCAALQDGVPHVRYTAAVALVTLFRTGKLDQAQRLLVLKQKDTITQKHEDRDYTKSSDCSDEGHYDQGIGVDFPT